MSSYCCICFALPGLPFWRPEPCLIWIYLLLLHMLTYRLNPRVEEFFGLLATFMCGFFDKLKLLISNLEDMTHKSYSYVRPSIQPL